MALRAFESFDHLLHVVPVDAAYIPTEAPVLFFQGLDSHHFLDRTINLQAIAVDDADQVVEMMVRCLHGRFPDLAFLLLAVAHDAEDLVILPVQLARQSQTDGNAQNLAPAIRSRLPRPATSTNADDPDKASPASAEVQHPQSGRSRQMPGPSRGWAPCARSTRRCGRGLASWDFRDHGRPHAGIVRRRCP